MQTMKSSKLSIPDILCLSFLNTAMLLQTFQNEITKSYCSAFSAKVVLSRVENLLENFNLEKNAFLDLCSEIDDLALKKLAFKRTESFLLSWKSELDGNSWWNSSLRERLNKISIQLLSDKENFKKLCE